MPVPNYSEVSTPKDIPSLQEVVTMMLEDYPINEDEDNEGGCNVVRR